MAESDSEYMGRYSSSLSGADALWHHDAVQFIEAGGQLYQGRLVKVERNLLHVAIRDDRVQGQWFRVVLRRDNCCFHGTYLGVGHEANIGQFVVSADARGRIEDKLARLPQAPREADNGKK